MAFRSSHNERPALPFGSPSAGVQIHLTAPIDTAATTQQPRNVLDRALVQAGDVRFTWTPVDGADSYALQANDISDAGGANASLTTWAVVWTDEPSATVTLGRLSACRMPG